jgi:hypothetical protein
MNRYFSRQLTTRNIGRLWHGLEGLDANGSKASRGQGTVKIEVVKRSEVLELMEAENMANVGGLSALKEWITMRRECFSQEAQEAGVDTPKAGPAAHQVRREPGVQQPCRIVRGAGPFRPEDDRCHGPARRVPRPGAVMKTSLVGQTFGIRLVVADTGRRTASGSVVWRSCCVECGDEKELIARELRKVKYPSCGCIPLPGPRKHGACESREYKAWCAMRRRCDDRRSKNYARYGGAGITYDPRWRVFLNFFADLGSCPPCYTLERRNNAVGYMPGNCYWADRKAQANNVSRNRHLEWNGEQRTMAQWADDPRLVALGITYFMLRARLNVLKWSVEKAMTTPRVQMGPQTYGKRGLFYSIKREGKLIHVRHRTRPRPSDASLET